MDPRPTAEQRVARRARTSLNAVWVVPRKKLLRKIEEEVACTIHNVSVTGLAVIAATEPLITKGTETSIVCNTLRCSVRVRRVGPTNIPGMTEYAMELLNPSRDFLETVLAGSELAERRQYEERWNRE